jgi:GT2 family glycosyltransferase
VERPLQDDAVVPAASNLIPPPDVFTCSGPRVLWIESNTAADPAQWLEPIIRHTKDLESVRFCHDGEAEEPGSLLRLIRGAHDFYQQHRREFPLVRWLHWEKALGYGGAVAKGVRQARFDWVYLLNSDMTMGKDALAAVARWRMPQVFAISSQVFWADSKSRREETGWTNYSISESGEVELFDAVPEDQTTVRGHLYAGGGNSLFRKSLLRRFLSRSHSYNPAYWEDVEWGVKAWRAGFEVLFCPESHIVHVHRATVSRLFSPGEVARIWKRNQLLFSLRNGFTGVPRRELIRHLRSTLDAKTQRELVTIRLAASLFLSLWENARTPAPDVDLRRACRKYYLREPLKTDTRPAALIVSPFAVFPPGHGGARRIASLIEQLSGSLDVILLMDEENELRPEHLARARGPSSIHLTGARPASTAGGGRVARIQAHSHERLRSEMERLALAYNVALIQVEHVELAALITRPRNGARHVIDLHDVLLSGGPPTDEDRFEQNLIAQYDGVLTCSREDAVLLAHRRVAVAPNGFTRPPAPYMPSRGSRAILFAGPFRFEPNLSGIVTFLEEVYPALRRDVPGVHLTILGGTGSRSVAARHACFGQPDITVIEEPVEMEPWLRQCAVTINPVPETRGSCVKVIESIGFGRVCVCTEAGARGFRELRAGSLITVPSIGDFLAPLRQLLLDEDYRARLEEPDDMVLADVTWQNVGRQLLVKYREWFGLELADGAADPD